MHIQPENNIPNFYSRKHNLPQTFVDSNGTFSLNEGIEHKSQVSFKGGLPSNLKKDLSKIAETITVDKALKILEEEVGTSAKEHFKEVIEKLINKKGSGVKLEDGKLKFAKDTFGGKVYRAVIDPVIYLPIDLANSTLGLLKKIPGLKNAEFIDKLIKSGPLERRSTHLEEHSNTMAIQHCFEMLGDKKTKNDAILREALKRCKVGQTEYTVKGERSLTRLVSGLIPAFFLANDAYNLSMYMNNNKDLAKKEKKRRFYQELSRVAVTAAATFGALGFFAKKVSSSPAMATGVIAGLTFASELIGRMLVRTPVYPIGKEDAKKYAKLQHKDKSGQNQNVSAVKSENKNDKSKSNYVLKLLGSMVVAGFLIDKHQSIKPVRKLVNNLKSRYKEFFAKDYKIERAEFNKIVKTLKDNGFEGIANRYEILKEKILDNGNLTTKEALQVEGEFEKRVEKLLPDFIASSKDLEKQRDLIKGIIEVKDAVTGKMVKKEVKAKAKVKKDDVIRDLFGKRKNNNSKYIYINGDLSKFFSERTNVDKTKDNIVNGFLALPIKFAWEILNMPYQYVVKPLIEIPLKGKDLLMGKEKELSCNDVFRKSVEYLHNNIDASNLKEKVNKNVIDAFDNVNKSNISSADLAGSAKVAVSTVTSGFLVLDNYNTVMIDSNGKDKEMAEQKAKERTIQRIVRIAYGAILIKFFNQLFRSQYDASLLGAEAVTAGNVLITESLERTSVGMPLHEATRDEIIEKDNEALNATGLKGTYFRFMSKLTGKKSVSKKEN